MLVFITVTSPLTHSSWSVACVTLHLAFTGCIFCVVCFMSV